MGMLREHIREKTSRINYFIVKEGLVRWSKMDGASRRLGRLGQVAGQLALLNKKKVGALRKDQWCA